jgi:hypothetical protein
MKRWYALLAFVLLGFSNHVFSQTEARRQLLGNWTSFNRPDTLTMKFKNDSIVYFEMKGPAPFNGQPFTYFVYKGDDQLLIELTPPSGKYPMKLLLWVLGPDEIKLQGVDRKDYDNPLLNIPKETNQNTFRLRRKG